MPTTGAIRNLRVRPSQSADLSFNMPGVISFQNYDFDTGIGTAHLGKSVKAFDIDNQLYQYLGETLPSDGDIEDGARLKYEAGQIRAILMTGQNGNPAPFLFALRNESLAASLDQIVDRRENAFLERYKHAAAISTRLQESYPEILARLNNLLTKSQQRFSLLDTEYANDGVIIKKGMVTATRTQVPAMAMWNTAISGDSPSGTHLITEVKDKDGNLVQKHEILNTASIPRLRDDAGDWKVPDSPTIESQSSEAATRDEQYSHPRLDNEMTHDQIMVSLHNDLIKQEAASHRVPHIERILRNELDSLDQEIRTLQVNFAHTFLFSPFDGIVTAIYKDVGEGVEPGEPIARVENDHVIYSVGQIQFRGVIHIGQAATIVADDLFETGQVERFSGTVVSIRGHETDNDEWDVIVEFENPVDPDTGRRLLPLNYHFDPETTRIEI